MPTHRDLPDSDLYSKSGEHKNKQLWPLWIAIAVVVILAGFVLVRRESEPEVTSFDDCVAAGNAVMESYPQQCRTSDGETFVEDIGNELEKIDLIRINNPRPNQTITSPLVIEGEARGFWFFEGDFPIKLLDEGGGVIATGIAQAQSEWMTEDFVVFSAEIEFATPESGKGTLILERDNPSGLPENDESLRVPVKFAKPE